MSIADILVETLIYMRTLCLQHNIEPGMLHVRYSSGKEEHDPISENSIHVTLHYTGEVVFIPKGDFVDQKLEELKKKFEKN